MRHLIVVTVVLLAACGNQAGQPTLEETVNAGRGAVGAAVNVQRGTTLRSAVIAAGFDCPALTRTFNQGIDTDTDTEYWNVSCASGDYVVTFGAGLEPVAATCAEARRTTGIDCFTAFE